jgi:hypothetical protein
MILSPASTTVLPHDCRAAVACAMIPAELVLALLEFGLLIVDNRVDAPLSYSRPTLPCRHA